MNKKLVFSVLLVCILALSLVFVGCDTGGGDGGNNENTGNTGDTGGSDDLKITITGLTAGTTYIITVETTKGVGLSTSSSSVKSAAADSSGTATVSYSYSMLKERGFSGECYIKYVVGSNQTKTKNTYSIVGGADIKLNATTDF